MNLIPLLAGFIALPGLPSIGFAQPTQVPEIADLETTSIISVTRSGDSAGRTVVLIPGLASSAQVWNETALALQQYDLRIIQVAGFGGAAKFDADGLYTDAIADALHKHLTDTPGKNPVIVGHSLGGYVAMKAALLDGTPIEELVIVDSVPFLAGIFMPGATPEQAQQAAPRFAQQMASMTREDFDQQQNASLSRLVKDKAFQDTLANWAAASDQSTVATAIGELLAADLRDDISDIEAKITVLVAHDKAMGISVEQVRDMYSAQYALSPDHQVIVVEQSLHFIMIDQTAVFLKNLENALSE